MSNLANYWSQLSHDVTLVTTNPTVRDFYETSPAVRRVRLKRRGSTHRLSRSVERLKVLLALRKVLRESDPHVIVSFIDLTNILTLAATVGTKLPVVVSERVDPVAHPLTPLWNIARRFLYRRAAAVVVQTSAVSAWASSVVDPERVHVVPNPIVPPKPAPPESIAELPPAPFVIGVGRLVHQKGFDILISAFSRCARTHPGWSLVIIGKGADEQALQELTEFLGIRDRVHFLGVTNQLGTVYRQGSLFVLSSRYEGFPNALVEAMAAGLPAIAADCPSGPRDIITSGVDGLLVPPEDVTALHLAMESLMLEPAAAAKFGVQARRVLERFSLQTVGREWEQVFLSVVGEPDR